jgi:glycerophosphoryl diester phosphodiesterase
VPVSPGSPLRRGLVCAHRGASLTLPDNSLAAFAAAVASGCEVIETDVRMGLDGRLVLAHDTWDLERADLVPLADLVELARGRIGLDLEIVELGLERLLLDALDGFPDWLIVTSTLPEVLTVIGRLSRHVATGLVVEAPYDGSPLPADPFALADACGVAVALVEDVLATPELIARAGEHGRPLWVWTVNEAGRIAELLGEPAVTGVITDDPALAVALRDQAPARVP